MVSNVFFFVSTSVQECKSNTRCCKTAGRCLLNVASGLALEYNESVCCLAGDEWYFMCVGGEVVVGFFFCIVRV